MQSSMQIKAVKPSGLFFVVFLASALVMELAFGGQSNKSPKNVVPSHCQANETVVFSCIAKNKKVISLCASKSLSAKNGYLQYHFGYLGKIEFTYPQDKKWTQKKFIYSRYTRSMYTDLTVRFTNKNTTYALYSHLDEEGGKPEMGAGISCSFKGSEKEVDIKCGKNFTDRMMEFLEGVLPDGGTGM